MGGALIGLDGQARGGGSGSSKIFNEVGIKRGPLFSII